MSSKVMKEFSRAMNAEARRQFPAITELTGVSSFGTAHLTRIALRAQTPYPYVFHEDDSFYPSDNRVFGRVINAGHEEGLQAIHSEISVRRKEHKWLFIPQSSQWIDTTLAAYKASVNSDQYVQSFLSFIYPELESVHIHPDYTMSMLAAEYPWQYSSNYLLEAALPSVDDLIHHVQMAARSAKTTKTTESVVSHHGVTSFKRVEAGELTGHFETEAYDSRISDYDAPAPAIRLALGTLSAHTLLYDGATPAFSFDFQPLNLA